jgi:hypothetical protein
MPPKSAVIGSGVYVNAALLKVSDGFPS